MEVPFDRIMDKVLAGETDAGLLIHEGQLTYGDLGLELLLDLGAEWAKETDLPMPLGLNVLRRDIGDGLDSEVLRVHRESIEYALSNRKEALGYAMRFGRGMAEDTGEKFVLMYVNEWTRDMGESGTAALELLFEKAWKKGVIPEKGKLDVLRD